MSAQGRTDDRGVWMTSRLLAVFAVLLVCAFVAVGCGDDEESTDTGATATEQTDTAAEDTTSEEDSGGAATGDVEEAVAACKKNADASADAAKASADPADVENFEEKIKEVCEKAGSGDAEDTAKVAKEACLAAAELAPEGPAPDQAKTACENTPTTP